ncbi:hypothetical protein HUT18_11725 [Streptomyces sp. NA04227]|uniref:hypothetical protein n=1 Tax=Streptomyces sp. NA04227 TaxID=2742136 RepID=UPI001590C26E|nr:hypothetical protein [Streptomyces sp. NA04227]QKW06967.1 hypothetical protein HUT18_11725 [Streptomyces sp. NA04227]
MTKTSQPNSPTVAIARILRGLGLAQGRGKDFRVEGADRDGERIGTYVLVLTRHAEETIAAHADDIERQAAAGPFPFRVSVQYPSDRPLTSIANFGDRVREQPPPPVPATVLAERRERARQQKRAQHLNWSTGQADLMAAAAASQLHYAPDGALRYYLAPGGPGRALDESRLAPLLKAGFLTRPGRRIAVTADGREALTLWRRWQPAPAVKDRKEDRGPLRPLLDGEEVARRNRASAENDRNRRAEANALREAMDAKHAWEERDDRLYSVWATVQGITHRLGRSIPTGWVPTAEEIAEHRIDPGLVAELRAEAEHPTPKPQIPWPTTMRAQELPPLPAVPDDAEQLELFGAT